MCHHIICFLAFYAIHSAAISEGNHVGEKINKTEVKNLRQMLFSFPVQALPAPAWKNCF